ncbi:hypothetical protein BGX38DRAFT_1188956 [Terfezia claveryi]|nr:hypothetical protein BGX38DRAFT_1188956 [Terfezia claveryi]
MPPKRPGSQFPLNRTKASEPQQAGEGTANAQATNELVEIHTLACTPVTGQRRKQYTREFKLATITYWRILLQSAVSLFLITQWVGEAWELLSNDLKESIVQSFRKCGITIALDGSEDSDINIRGLEG